jgi:hypothetical protein
MASDLEERETHGEEERKPERTARKRSRDATSLGARLVLAIILLGILIVAIWRVLTPQDGRMAMVPTPTSTPKAVTATPRPTFTPRPLATETPLPRPTATSTSTTPQAIAEGGYTEVTAERGLRFRYSPTLNSATWRIVPKGEILKVTGGPREVDGCRWWRVVDQKGYIGWAAEQCGPGAETLLSPTVPPAWTPLPEKNPPLDVTATPQG